MSYQTALGETSSLVDKYWDDTIDGDRTNYEDVESFLDPFLNTLLLQQSPT